MTLMVNSDIPAGAIGSFLQFSPKGSTGPAQQSTRTNGRYRVLILASMDASTGIATPSMEYPILSSVDAIQKWGRTSGVRRGYEYVRARVPAGLDIHGVGIPVSTGAAATALINALNVGGGSVAVGSGACQLRIDDCRVDFAISNGDSNSTIMTNAKAAIDALNAATSRNRIPMTAGVIGGTGIPLTWSSKGVHGADHPISVNIPPSITGVRLSPGSCLFANGPTGAGSGIVTVRCGSRTITATGIALGQTDAQVCAAVIAAINADGSFPVQAQVNSGSSATLDFLYVNGRPAMGITVTVNGAIGPMTATVTADTAGSGTPVLSTALTNLAGSDAFGEWITEFNDATSIGSLVNHIRTYGNGYYQKEQFLTWGSTTGMVASNSLVTSISPTVVNEDGLLDKPGLFTCFWVPDANQTAFELACLRAAARGSQRYVAKNGNGMPLYSSNPDVDLTYPDQSTRPDPETSRQARVLYHLCPGIVAGGQFQIESDVTTYGGTERGWNKSSYSHAASNYRQEVIAELSRRFAGKDYIVNSVPLTDEVFTSKAVEDAVNSVNVRLELQNLFDGAALAQPLIQAGPDPDSPGNVLVNAPFFLPFENDSIAGQIYSGK